MALNGLTKLSFALSSKSNLLNVPAIRFASAWNRDWKPGPYPVTKEEREAAAARYNLHPKDYEPYPDDGFGHGDYPKLKPWSGFANDPHGSYDDPYNRRDFGEVLHAEADMYTQERVNPADFEQDDPSLFMQYVMYIGLMSVFYALYLLGDKYAPVRTALPHQYPKKGETHYTFPKQ